MKRKYIFSVGALGIIFMMLGQLSFSINDTLVKEIVIDSKNNMSVINIIFLRGLITTTFIFLYLKYYERKNILDIVKIKKYHQRGIYEVLTAICFFTGLILLPVSEVYTLLMTNPFFVTIFAFLFLKEKVGIRRWTAVIIGFVGVLIVINPQNINFNFLFLFPIIAAVFLTIRDIKTKDIATKTNSFVKKVSKLIPLGRMATANEYSGIIKFLCSDESSYLNGAIIPVDGGRTVW